MSTQIMQKKTENFFAPSRVFGANASASDSLFFIDSRRLAFFSGSYLVFHDTTKNTQLCISLCGRSREISAEGFQAFGVTTATLSSDQNWLAIAMAGHNNEAGFVVHVFDTSSKAISKRLHLADKSQSIISLSFSNDSTYLAAVTDFPQQIIHVWKWESAKVFANVPCSKFVHNIAPMNHENNIGHVRCISFAQVKSGSYNLVLIGNHVFRVLKFQPELPVTLRAPCGDVPHYQDYGNCAWIGSQAVVGAGDGTLSIFTLNETKVDVEWQKSGHVLGVPIDQAPSSIQNYDGGILVSFKNFVMACSIYTSSTGYLFVTPNKVWKMQENAELRYVSISSSFDSIACLLSNNQILVAKTLGEAFVKTFELDESMFTFNSLMPISHSGKIVALDTCIRKPWNVSASEDGTIRVWNQLNGEIIASKSFGERCYDMSFHPSGLFIAATFSTGARLLSITNDDLIEVEHHRGATCRKIAFSNGGERYAYNNDGAIVACFSWQPKYSQRILTGFKNISVLQWTNDGSSLLYSDGLGRIKEATISQSPEQSIVYEASGAMSEFGVLAFVELSNTSGSRTLLISHGDGSFVMSRNSSTVWKMQNNQPVANLKIFNDTVFAATLNNEIVRLAAFDWMTDAQPSSIAKFGTHKEKITAMTINKNCACVITGCASGTVQIHSVSNVATPAMEYFDDILVTKRTLSNYTDEQVEVTALDNKFTKLSDDAAKSQNNDQQSRLQTLNDKEMSKMNQLKSEMLSTKEGILQLKLANMQDHQTALEVCARTFNTRKQETEDNLLRQKNKTLEVQSISKASVEEANVRAARIQNLQISQISALQTTSDRKLFEMQAEKKQLQADIETCRVQLETFDQDLENVVTEEVMKLLGQNEQALSDARKETAKSREDSKKLKVTTSEYIAAINENTRLAQAKKNDVANLEESVNVLQKDLQILQGELKARIEIEHEKDKYFDEGLKAFTDLTKLKFLLENKLNAENENMAPRCLKLQDVRQQYSAMSDELSKMMDFKTHFDIERRNLEEMHRMLVTVHNKMRLRTRALQTVQRQIRKEYGQIVHGKLQNADRESHLRMQKSVVEFFHRLCPNASAQVSTETKGYIPKSRASVTVEDNTVADILKLCDSIPRERKLNSIEELDLCIAEILQRYDPVVDMKKKRSLMEKELSTVSRRMLDLETNNRLAKRKLSKEFQQLLHDRDMASRVHNE